MTTTLRVDHLIVEWAAGWASRDVERVASVFSEDCVYEDVPLGVVNRGRDELRAFGAAFLAAVPDFDVKLRSHVAAGAWAAAEWQMTGTHVGDLPDMPATGRRFAVRGASVFEIADGKLRRCSDYWDSGSWLRQLGFIA
jgi:steroid delta-isomerase-like uncharacterized protein